MKLEVEGLLGQVFHPRPLTAYFLIPERTVFNFMPDLGSSFASSWPSISVYISQIWSYFFQKASGKMKKAFARMGSYKQEGFPLENTLLCLTLKCHSFVFILCLGPKQQLASLVNYKNLWGRAVGTEVLIEIELNCVMTRTLSTR